MFLKNYLYFFFINYDIKYIFPLKTDRPYWFFNETFLVLANVRFYVINLKFMNDKYMHNFIKLIPFRNITISLFIYSFLINLFFPPHFLKASKSTLQHHIWCVVYQDVGTTREVDITDNISQGYPLPRKNIYLCNCLVL